MTTETLQGTRKMYGDYDLPVIPKTHFPYPPDAVDPKLLEIVFINLTTKEKIVVTDQCQRTPEGKLLIGDLPKPAGEGLWILRVIQEAPLN